MLKGLPRYTVCWITFFIQLELNKYTLAPLSSSMRYKIDIPPSDYWSNGLYFGKPGPDSERAWNRLIRRKGFNQDLHEHLGLIRFLVQHTA